jgi:hypothetical protein
MRNKPQISAKPVKSGRDLFKRGNVGLARLLLVVHDAGPDGIATYKMLYRPGSTNHAKAFIKRAKDECLI